MRAEKRCDVKKKIDKKTREQAALICAIGASDPGDGDQRLSYDLDIASRLGVRRDSAPVLLAMQAWAVIWDRDEKWTQATDAEAEALLRTGWSPS